MVGAEDRRSILLKKINDAIQYEQAYLRIKWKGKQYDQAKSLRVSQFIFLSLEAAQTCDSVGIQPSLWHVVPSNYFYNKDKLTEQENLRHRKPDD